MSASTMMAANPEIAQKRQDWSAYELSNIDGE